MKKLFQLIKKGDLASVKALAETKPELVNCVAKQPPKTDDGQSPLQIALKNGRFAIAAYLLEKGADVNFVESEACCNPWRAPVLHDAINAAVMCSRWNTYDPASGALTVFSDKETADAAFHILEQMILRGADVNAADSFGNTCLWRFCLQAAQILPTFHWQDKVELQDRLFTDELKEDLSRIFGALCRAGMDLQGVSRVDGKTVLKHMRGSPFLKF